MMSPKGRHAVLVGAGHAHLHTLKRAAEFARRGHRLTIVAPGPFWYSGLATGMLGGLYPPALDRIDVAALARDGGADFVADRLAGLDAAAGMLQLESGRSISFDALSLNLGSEPPPIPGGDGPNCYSVKPIPRLRDLRHDLEDDFGAGKAPRVLVAGAGITGCELAANIAGLAERSGGALSIVVASGGDILAQVPAKARSRVVESLEARGIVFRRGARIVSVGEGTARLASGGEIGFDRFVNSAGLRPRHILRNTGLPLDDEGALIVDSFLRVPAHPAIHAGGDCIAIEGRDLARIGVYAIREAPILHANLMAALEGTPPRRFEPQARYLWIMNLGDGTGLAMRGNRFWQGRLAFRLKDWIDRRFLAAYRPSGA